MISKLFIFIFITCAVVIQSFSMVSYNSNSLQLKNKKCQLEMSIPLVSSALGLTLSLSLGNIGEAVTAILKNPEAITCTLDTQQADENHGSCQLLDDVVRLRAGKLLTIHQDWGGSASTGAAVWNGANMAGWYLENEIGSKQITDKSILELGAGVGFTSLIAESLGATDVVISDGNEDVLKLADENILINVPESERQYIRTAKIRWNTEDEDKFMLDKYNKPWDYIIAADVTYLKKNRPDLISSIAKLSGPNTITLLSMEPRNVDEVQDVISEIEKKGLSWIDLSNKLPIDPVKEQCSLLCARIFALTKK